MTRAEDIERIVTAAHTLTRVAALSTSNDAPSAQWRALSVLQQEGSLRVGDLARMTRTTQPGMTRLAHQLADEGLVERGGDPADSRATVVSITPAGDEALAHWREQLGLSLEPLFADIGEHDWDVLAHAARILSDRVATPAGANR